MSEKRSGVVASQSGHSLPQQHYDIIIVGAGFSGLAAAFYLQRSQPDARILLIERSGIPSEEGMSYLSPGIVHSQQADPEQQRRARWGRERLAHLPEETDIHRPQQVFFPVGYVTGYPDSQGTAAQSFTELLAKLEPDAAHNLQQVADWPTLCAQGLQLHYDPEGGYASAEAAALHYAYAAVRQGLDILLNSQVTALGDNGRLELERLAFNRYMQREVVRRQTLHADMLLLCNGADIAPLVEAGLGQLMELHRVYLQYPRIETCPQLRLRQGRVHMPVLHYQAKPAAGLCLRPQGEGLLIVPEGLAADPVGYQPEGGRLFGVPVGLRRELLEPLLANLEQLPALGWPQCNLGKSVHNVRGGWQTVTKSGLPEWYSIEADIPTFALAAAHAPLNLALAAAYDLVAHISALPSRPWARH